MTKEAREIEYAKTADHDRPKWTWEGNEAALIELTERLEREKENV